MARLMHAYQAVLRSLVDSAKINSVSWPAEALYMRLLLVADGAGRCWGDPHLVACQAAARRLGSGTSVEDIEALLVELEGAGLLRRWCVGGERYLEIAAYYDGPRGEQRRPVRFPDPPPIDPRSAPDRRQPQASPDGADEKPIVPISAPRGDFRAPRGAQRALCGAPIGELASPRGALIDGEPSPPGARRAPPGAQRAPRGDSDMRHETRVGVKTRPTLPRGGTELDSCCSTLASIVARSTAAAVHDAAQKALIAAGWLVEREVPVDDRGDGRGGRVDLVARRDGISIGIEIDRETPRRNSVEKLHRLALDYRVVLVRGHSGPVDGLDRVVSLGLGGPAAPRFDPLAWLAERHPEADPRIAPAAAAWADYRRERKLQPWSKMTWERQLRRALLDPAAWVAELEHAIASGWHAPVDGKGGAAAPGPTPRQSAQAAMFASLRAEFEAAETAAAAKTEPRVVDVESVR